MLRARNERVLAQIAPDANEVLGCNTRADLAGADRVLRARKAAELMNSGVTIYLPETVVIDPGATAGPDTVIEQGVQLLGQTRIGVRCQCAEPHAGCGPRDRDLAAGACLFSLKVDQSPEFNRPHYIDTVHITLLYL